MRMNQLAVALEILKFLWDNPMSKSKEIAAHIDYSDRQTRRYLSALTDADMVKHYEGYATGWRALGQFKRRDNI